MQFEVSMAAQTDDKNIYRASTIHLDSNQIPPTRSSRKLHKSAAATIFLHIIEEVANTIKCFKNNKATGEDDLPADVMTT